MTDATRKRPRPDDASFGIFGVYFRYSNAGLDWMNVYMARWRPVQERIRLAMLPVVDRQHRHYVNYWDAMTWLENLSGPQRAALGDIDELRLLEALMRSLARNRLDQEPTEDLLQLAPIREIGVQDRWHDAKVRIEEGEAQARTNPVRLQRNRRGDLQLASPGLYRRFFVNMGDAGGSLSGLHWERLLVLALLVQLKADLEVFYESGHQRLGRCGHRDCRAWFLRKPMGQKQRFCCDVCRALSFRKASKPVAS